jgi:hypothetical protein
MVLQPRRCRMPESRSSLVAVVRLVMCLFGVLQNGYGCEGDGCVSEGGVAVFATCACLMPCAANGGSYSNVVDIFNVRSGTWSTAALSQARGYLAATSLPDAGVAIFAGGKGTSCDVFCLACCGMGMGVRGMDA